MSSIRMNCPHCNAPMEFALHQAGQVGPCYRCGKDVKVAVMNANQRVQVHGFMSDDPARGMSHEQAAALAASAQATLAATTDVSQKINAAARLLTSGAHQEAAEAYRTIAEAHPEERGTCYSQIGAALYFLKEYQTAIEWYKAAENHGADPRMMKDNIEEALEAIARGG